MKTSSQGAQVVAREALPAWVADLHRTYGRLPQTGRRLLLAVSGGPDSMALLEATALAAPLEDLHVEVACLDHGLRSEAADEVRTVRSFSEQRGFPFHTERLEISPGPSVEARCRAARYAALERIRKASDLSLILTAHTADDQAETLLLRLARGTALKGASGIRPRMGRLLRPLLGVRRRALWEFALARGLPFHRDPMNEDPQFARTRARGLLPALEAALGRQSVTAMARFCEWAHQDDLYLSQQTDQAYARISAKGGLDRLGLISLPEPLARRALAKLLEEQGLGVDAGTLSRALLACHRGGQATLPERALLRTTGGWVRVVRAEPKSTSLAPIPLVPRAWVPHPPSGLEFYLDAVQARYWVRTGLPGDRLGFGNRGKLQDLFVDLRVPREVRRRVPLVVGEDGRVVYVVGVGEKQAIPLAIRIQAGRAAPAWLQGYKVTSANP